MKASQWLKSVQFWLLPGVCVACRKPSGRAEDLCAPCFHAFVCIERPCRGCGLALPPGELASLLCGRCIGRERRIARTVAAFAYAGPVPDLIAGFKYRGALQHGRVLGDLLLPRLRHAYATASLPDLLLPVPLHPARLRERGFNQALVLARQLGAALQVPVAAGSLVRARHTPAQQGLSARERKRNLRGAFELRADLAGAKTIALVDDVVTTMSTMHEIAHVLWRARPDLEVHVWCLARA